LRQVSFDHEPDEEALVAGSFPRRKAA